MLTIGSLKLKNWLVLAPMSGITNLPFRLMIKKLGPALVTTEMVSAMGLIRGQKKTLRYLKSHSDEKPLAVQIFGAQPEVMAEAARRVVAAGADIVDINMGCPAKKVLKTGSGGALLRMPERVKKIVSSVRRACSVPLTAKIRAGWSADEPVTSEISHIIEDSGVDALTIHPRFVSQGFSGMADWTVISKLKKQLKIPVIGNGDVFSPSLALKMKNQTGCDAVMLGRAAVGNPWIFRQIAAMENGGRIYQPTLSERRAFLEDHFRLLSDFEGENRAAFIMRGLLLRYTKGLPHCSRFRESVTHINDYETLISALDRYFFILEEEAH
jgi:tRNA-dihydrouridine synthase B